MAWRVETGGKVVERKRLRKRERERKRVRLRLIIVVVVDQLLVLQRMSRSHFLLVAVKICVLPNVNCTLHFPLSFLSLALVLMMPQDTTTARTLPL